MKKLKALLRWIDDNLLPASIIFFIFITPLFPKSPVADVGYTYIKIRYDDFFIIPVLLIFILQLARRKVKLHTRFLLPIALFWGAVFLSYFVGQFVQDTLPVHCQPLFEAATRTQDMSPLLHCTGILHSLRRIQYMLIFFVAASAIDSERTFMRYMKLYLFALFLVTIYGLGQKFVQFPSIQSMNPAYVDGRILILKPEDRINATFGGHFDLAAYLIFSMPILLGFLFYLRKMRYLVYFVLSLMALLYTSARSSFIAYVGSITLYLLYIRKYMFLAFVAVLTAALLFVTGDMTKRILQTLQIKTIFVNLETGQTSIDQKLTTKELPAGNLKITIPKKVVLPTGPAGGGGPAGSLTPQEQAKLYEAAYEQAKDLAKSKGEDVTSSELDRRAVEIAKVLQPQQQLLCDISCSTRLQIEWPRAISHFLYSPFFGTGPSSLGEATDNSFLRWLGEFGLLGTSIFVILLYSIMKYIGQGMRGMEPGKKYIFYGYLFGFMALLINALYVDAFEASKVAYNFWLVTGFYVGVVEIYKRKPEVSAPTSPRSIPRKKRVVRRTRKS